MKNRGFTLLELLGVIVILALLTTLVFPNILNTIKKSSNKTDELSMKLISNASDLYIENHANEFIKFNGNKYKIEIQDLIDDGNLPSNIKISDVDNLDNKCIQVTYQDKFKYELKDKGTCEKLVQFDSICKLASDSTVTGLNAGAKYNCKVDPNKKPYTFYVLTTPQETDTSVNLIMDRNICRDGTPTDSEKIDKCVVAWYLIERNNSYGPVTAIEYLKQATSSWSNIPDLDIIVNDEGTNFKDFKITAKSRLPYKSEVSVFDIEKNNGYLYENLDSSSWSYDETSKPTNNISGISGYWTISSRQGRTTSAWIVLYYGYVDGDYVDNNNNYGIRPVITLALPD